MRQKSLLSEGGDDSGISSALPSCVGVDGFKDFLVWKTLPIFTVEDLVGSTDSSHCFQAMGINPQPLPKENENKWKHSSSEAAVQVPFHYSYTGSYPFHSSYTGSYVGRDPLILEKNTAVGNNAPDAHGDNDNQVPLHLCIGETPPIVAIDKSVSKNRDLG